MSGRGGVKGRWEGREGEWEVVRVGGKGRGLGKVGRRVGREVEM